MHFNVSLVSFPKPLILCESGWHNANKKVKQVFLTTCTSGTVFLVKVVYFVVGTCETVTAIIVKGNRTNEQHTI